MPLHVECTCCRFQWVDGALTRAVESGQWVLLDSANLCNPTVLDRLNPLLEPDGELLLVRSCCGDSGSTIIADVGLPFPSQSCTVMQ